MIVNLHQDNRRDVLLDLAVISEGLAKAMAGDLSNDSDGCYGIFDNAPCLNSANRRFLPSTIGKYKIPIVILIEQLKGCERLLIQSDCLLLAGLMLHNREMCIKLAAPLIINLIPSEAKKVAYPKRRTCSKNDHRIVTVLASEEKVLCQILSCFLSRMGIVAAIVDIPPCA